MHFSISTAIFKARLLKRWMVTIKKSGKNRFVGREGTRLVCTAVYRVSVYQQNLVYHVSKDTVQTFHKHI